VAQTITQDGKELVVIVPYDKYKQLIAPGPSLAAFFSSAPRADLAIARHHDEGRQVDF